MGSGVRPRNRKNFKVGHWSLSLRRVSLKFNVILHARRHSEPCRRLTNQSQEECRSSARAKRDQVSELSAAQELTGPIDNSLPCVFLTSARATVCATNIVHTPEGTRPVSSSYPAGLAPGCPILSQRRYSRCSTERSITEQKWGFL